MPSRTSLQRGREAVDPGAIGGPESGARVLRADSISRPVLRILRGTSRRGVAVGCGYIDVGSYVIAIVPPGGPRMPNGIEVPLTLSVGQEVQVGEGRLATCQTVVLPGPVWEPRPSPHVELGFEGPFALNCGSLVGRGEGLTPAGDDLVAGYLAGRQLLLGESCENLVPPEGSTTKLSRTLLEHAARGDVPGPVHALLERGECGPLLRFGHSSGRWMLIGICLGAVAGGAVGWGTPNNLSDATATRLLSQCRIRVRSGGWRPFS
jgi:hypothetical protein